MSAKSRQKLSLWILVGEGHPIRWSKVPWWDLTGQNTWENSFEFQSSILSKYSFPRVNLMWRCCFRSPVQIHFAYTDVSVLPGAIVIFLTQGSRNTTIEWKQWLHTILLHTTQPFVSYYQELMGAEWKLRSQSCLVLKLLQHVRTKHRRLAKWKP